MARICENCGKHTTFGHTKQHRRGVAGKRWKKRVPARPRVFKPNLQVFQGRKLCAKCIKRLKKDAREAALQA